MSPSALDCVALILAPIWLALLVESLRSKYHLHRVPVGSNGSATGLVKVSVIVPVRGHVAEALELLEDLRVQARPFRGLEVVVVDDRNPPEGAAELLRACSKHGAIYVRVDSVPSGWYPKSYALYRGFEASEGDVLVFLDADVRLRSRETLKAMVAAALETRGIAGFIPRFNCPTLACKLLMASILGFAHSYTGFHKVSSRKSSVAWMYGCCWSVTRRIYEDIGTHKAVADSYVEDRDFAERAKKKGYEVAMYEGTRFVETKWYPRPGEIVEVLSRVLLRRAVALSWPRVLLESAALALIYTGPLVAAASTPIALPVLAAEILVSAIGSIQAGISPAYAVSTPLTGIAVPAAYLLAKARGYAKWRDIIVRETPATWRAQALTN